MNKKNKVIIFLFRIIPTCFFSRLAGYISQINFPNFLMLAIINWYCKTYNVNRSEYIIPEEGFKNFDMFFTRLMKDGVHTVNSDENSVISPVDGRIQEMGVINGSSILQAKGIEYSLGKLIPSSTAENFIDGSFMTIYLSPSDYHRIHSPVNGNIEGYFNIPGKLYTVQDYMVRGYKGLYSINERLISYIQSENGLVAVCKIGAMDVGRITLSYADAVTNRAFRERKEIIYDDNRKTPINKGDELGTFHIGSTIILLFQKDRIKFNNFNNGNRVRMGEVIGKFV